jgi:hypothetical protein
MKILIKKKIKNISFYSYYKVKKTGKYKITFYLKLKKNGYQKIFIDKYLIFDGYIDNKIIIFNKIIKYFKKGVILNLMFIPYTTLFQNSYIKVEKILNF